MCAESVGGWNGYPPVGMGGCGGGGQCKLLPFRRKERFHLCHSASDAASVLSTQIAPYVALACLLSPDLHHRSPRVRKQATECRAR
jgi:hypothetical protein